MFIFAVGLAAWLVPSAAVATKSRRTCGRAARPRLTGVPGRRTMTGALRCRGPDAVCRRSAACPVPRSPPLGLVPQRVQRRQSAHSTMPGRPNGGFWAIGVRYQDRLCNLCSGARFRRRCRDAAQDAFVQAFQKLKTFRGNSAFYSWLFRIALNAAATACRRTRTKPTSIDSMRSQRTHSRRSAPGNGSVAFHGAGRTSSGGPGGLGRFPPNFESLVLKEIDGMKYQEIAQIVGCPSAPSAAASTAPHRTAATPRLPFAGRRIVDATGVN